MTYFDMISKRKSAAMETLLCHFVSTIQYLLWTEIGALIDIKIYKVKVLKKKFTRRFNLKLFLLTKLQLYCL